MLLSAIRVLVVALGVTVFEVVCLLLFFGVMFGLADIDPHSLHPAPYGLRAAGAVVTVALGVLTAGAAAFVALRVGRRWLGEELLKAVFIVAVLNGFLLFFVLGFANFLNDYLWNVPFPFGDQGEFR